MIGVESMTNPEKVGADSQAEQYDGVAARSDQVRQNDKEEGPPTDPVQGHHDHTHTDVASPFGRVDGHSEGRHSGAFRNVRQLDRGSSRSGA